MYILDGHEALGTKWWIEIFDKKLATRPTEIKSEIIAGISDFEDKYSRFKPDSILSQLNISRSLKFPPNDLVKMLTLSQDLHEDTKGLFNCLVGITLESLGYGTPATKGSNDTQIIAPELTISAKKIILHNKNGNIDLGGIGKGYLIDKLAQLLKDLGAKYFIINGGGDIYATSKEDEPIELAIEHPQDNSKYIATIQLRNQSLCSSSSMKRQWKDSAGKLQSHIINPITNSSHQSNWLSSHVLHNTATIADVMATIALLASPELIEKLANKYEFEFLLTTENRVVKSAGFK